MSLFFCSTYLFTILPLADNTEHDWYTDVHHNVPNYYTPTQDAFAVDWNLNAGYNFPSIPDFSVFPGISTEYNTTTSSSKSIPHSETSPSISSFNTSGNISSKQPKRVNRHGPDHIPHPHNAFIIFKFVLHAHRAIARILIDLSQI